MTARDVCAAFFEREGGWGVVTDRPADRGGLTKGGISMKHFNAWRAKKGLTPLIPAAFKEISREDAEAFLADEFMEPFRFITDEPLKLCLMDFAMNAGPDDPVEALQWALAAQGKYHGTIDGVVGPKTRAAWDAVKHDQAIVADISDDVTNFRVMFHAERALDKKAREFIKQTPDTQLRNLLGWVRRALECRPRRRG